MKLSVLNATIAYYSSSAIDLNLACRSLPKQNCPNDVNKDFGRALEANLRVLTRKKEFVRGSNIY
jgi:hypothetical protein